MTINGEGEIATYSYDFVDPATDLASTATSAVPLAGAYVGTDATDNLGNVTTRYSDGAGRAVATIDPLDNVAAGI